MAERDGQLRETDVRIVNAPVAGKGVRRFYAKRKLKKLLSNGYEIVQCGDRDCLAFASRCGKIYADKGLTEYELFD